MVISTHNSLIRGLFLFALTCFLGCGTSSYEVRLSKWVRNNQGNSRFNMIDSPAAVPGATFKICLPKVPSSFTLLGEGSVDKKRLKPGKIDFPGLKATYEAFVEDSTKHKTPYYIYAGMLQDSPRTVQGINNSFSDGFDSISPLEIFTGENPEGTFVEWNKIHGTTKMDFAYIDPQGKETYKTLDAVFEVLYRKSGDQIYLIGWRAPKDYVDYIRVQEWLPLVAGTVTEE
ncbi:MAG: hypothetical protein JXB10_08640 [Pirellulales bacterium]|nr:hypothetical protein [Pirellulales bacterium]